MDDDTIHNQWALEYPSQAVTTTDAIWWTSITEDYLQPQNNQDIYQWYESTVIQIDDLTQVIVQEMSAIQRRTIVSLITQEVHFRDVVADLYRTQVKDLNDFKW